MIARVVAVAAAAAVAVALVALAAANARAEEPSAEALEDAREFYSRAADAFAVGRYDEALIAFEDAYARSHLPTILPNIAACQEKLGQDATAAETLRTYLATPGVRDRAAAEAELHAIEARLHPAPTLVIAPVVAPPPSRVPALRRAVIGSGIGTAVLGVTAGALTIAAASRYHGLAGDCDLHASGCSPSAANDLARIDHAADALWALTGAAAIVTVTLHLVLRHERARAAR